MKCKECDGSIGLNYYQQCSLVDDDLGNNVEDILCLAKLGTQCMIVVTCLNYPDHDCGYEIDEEDTIQKAK